MSQVLTPGSCLGVIGGGQLGRMFVQAAQRMGYRTLVFSDEPDSPAGEIAHGSVVAEYDNLPALHEFARGVQAITLEFENLPAAALRWLQRRCTLNPGWRPVWVAQNRMREKRFLTAINVPVAPWWPIRNRAECAQARTQFDGPRILKTASFGYDGKGQIRLSDPSELEPAWDETGRRPCVLEAVVPFAGEVSCLVVRASAQDTVAYPVMWNEHQSQILDCSVCPAPIGPRATQRVQALALEIAQALGVVGLLTVEFFLTPDGNPIVNELAPRPHNSGHLTIEACANSQFEQQVRVLCGLPLGSAELIRPAAMANLLGDCWTGGEPRWEALRADRAVSLHLYGKKSASIGRKMGHLTALDTHADQARARVLAMRSALRARLEESARN